MCQLCRVTDIADRDRWVHAPSLKRALPNHPLTQPQPKPLEPTLAELRDVVRRAHPDVKAYNNGNQPPSPARERHRQGLVTTARVVLAALALLESERGEWWARKGAQRREWERAAAWQRLTALQSVNNKTQAMVREMEAKVGMFARWSLGVEGLEAGE